MDLEKKVPGDKTKPWQGQASEFQDLDLKLAEIETTVIAGLTAAG